MATGNQNPKGAARSTELESRMATAETNITNLAKNVAEMSETVKALAKATETGFTSLSQNISTATAPKAVNYLGVITTSVGVIGLILVLWAAALVPIYLQLGYVEKALAKQDRTRERLAVLEYINHVSPSGGE